MCHLGRDYAWLLFIVSPMHACIHSWFPSAQVLLARRFNGAMFITFTTDEAYKAALAAHGEELEGRKLRVREACVCV